jgi:alkanesulfonate monooxygenase SsuD/methylene tetrahydromethanopterin reductase-like flavin-dependent oxidoreductase (luciferase family)
MLLRIFTEPQQGAGYDDLLAVAQASESLGFDAFFRSDHYLAMGDADGLPGSPWPASPATPPGSASAPC